jgi:hypothetical protein
MRKGRGTQSKRVAATAERRRGQVEHREKQKDAIFVRCQVSMVNRFA